MSAERATALSQAFAAWKLAARRWCLTCRLCHELKLLASAHLQFDPKDGRRLIAVVRGSTVGRLV